jgi:anti-sigma regulatory factor (Ser/Thr protein kinase)
LTEAEDGSAAESQAAVDALLVAADVAGGTGWELLERLCRGPFAPVALVYAADSAALVRRAFRCGALDAWPGRPSGLEVTPLLRSALGARQQRSQPGLLELEMDTSVDSERLALRHLGALGQHSGLGPAARARLLTAAAEMLENCRRHGYPQDPNGSVRLEARGEQGQVVVSIEDRGQGFEPDVVDSDQQHCCRDLADFPAGRAYAAGGLVRAQALCERFEVASDPGQGTRVELTVRGYPAAFGSAEDSFFDAFDESVAPLLVDFSDHEHFAPSELRRLLLAVGRGGGEPAQALPPALAVTLGRLLNAGRRAAGRPSKRSA